MGRVAVRLETSPQFTHRGMIEFASLAESRGYESIWLPEGSASDALTPLTAAALSTGRIGLATGILPIFWRSPTLVAMSAANLDAISGQRFVLGLGVGHRVAVEDWHGIPFDRPLARVREAVDIIRGLINGDRLSYRGKVYSVKEAKLGFSPVRPRLPIYIAAMGPRMLELAGEIADGVLLTWASPKYMEPALEHISVGARRSGRAMEDIDVASYLRAAVCDDDDTVRDAVQHMIAGFLKGHNVTFYKRHFGEMGFQREAEAASEAWTRGDADGAAAAITDRMQRELVVFGSARDCAQQIEARRVAGLKLPIIAPFTVKDPRESFETTINSFSGDHSG